MSAMLAAALEYARRGWPVLPVAPGQKMPAIAKGAGGKGFHDASVDEAKIRAWWANERRNVGVSTGPAGLIVVDVDPRNGGDESLADLVAIHGEAWRQTATVLTAGGGTHYYLRAPDGMEIHGKDGVWPGIDVKAHGGYVVAPPSYTPMGEYCWEVEHGPDECELAPAPDWLISALEERSAKSPRRTAAPLPVEIKAGGRNDVLTSAAGSMRSRSMTATEMLPSLLELNSGRCRPPLPEREVRAIALSVGRYEPGAAGRGDYPRKCTDLGNGERLADRFRDELKYCPALGWLSWDGRRWEANEAAAERAAKAVARGIWYEVGDAADEETRKRLAQHAARSESARAIAAMLQLARSDVRFAIEVAELDAHPMLLNVRNGTIDLRSMTVRAHERSDLITKVAPVDFDAEASAPIWMDFLSTITCHDVALLAYLQRAIGYAVTGLTYEHVLFILWGRGRNGKSTLLETVRYVLGDYAGNVAAETLARARRSAGGPAEDIARLAGVRFATAAETEEDAKLAEALVKRMTGGDRMTARLPYARASLEFQACAKIFLATNYRPRISGTDEGIWKRIQLVPFLAEISVEQEDRHLPDKLQAEAAGILNWALAGLADYLSDGKLLPPPAVRNATAGYRTEMDALLRFVNQECLVGQEHEVRSGDLYSIYSAWCSHEDERPVAQRLFSGRLIQELKCRKEERRDGNYLLGIGLADEVAPDDQTAVVEDVELVEGDQPSFLSDPPLREDGKFGSTSSTSSTSSTATSNEQDIVPDGSFRRCPECNERPAPMDRLCFRCEAA